MALGFDHVAELLEADADVALARGRTGVGGDQAFADLEALSVEPSSGGEIPLGDEHIAKPVEADADVVLALERAGVGGG